MNAERLLQLYDRVSEAPDAIPRLRRFILDLAVRGKLVEQDPNDAPVKQSLSDLAMDAYGPGLAEDLAMELPFARPTGWINMPLDRVGRISGGMTPSKSRQDYWGGEIAWLSPKDIKADEVFDSELKITTLGLNETRLELYPPGSLFIVARSGILKRTLPVAISRVPAAANQDMKVLIPFMGGLERYIQIALRGLEGFILQHLVKTGTTVQSLKYSEFEKLPIPLAPLAEQQRIVAKVDELMTLCDSLEAEREKREATRDRLTTASLSRLTAPDVDEKQFKAHADFAINVLPELTTRPDQIKVLRQTILDLAVRGKLVEQDPNDEPVEVLLQRVDAEKARLGNGRTRRAPQLEHGLLIDPAPFDIPQEWRWRRLDDVLLKLTDGTHHSPPNMASGDFKYITAKNIKEDGVSLDGVTYIPEQVHLEIYSRCNPEKGDILYVKDGATTGIVTINNLDEPFSMLSSVALLKFPSCLYNKLIVWFLRSPFFYGQMRSFMKGAAIPRVTLKRMAPALIPIPPLKEQFRIVARIDELMALCNKLEKSLSAGEQTRNYLVESLLLHALKLPESIAP